jgi:glycosyltransferase involved in cell wall biosynthesis
VESITWFLPDFTNPFYGGVHTLLRFADGFFRKHTIRSHFCILSRAPESRIRGQIQAAFPLLAASCRVFTLPSATELDRLPPTDAAVCSLWTTAYAALAFEKSRRKFYFIQDDEALFYPAGSISALVEATYRFGFLGICNTPSLLTSYSARGGEGTFFTPCIDTSVFYDSARREHRRPKTLFCYARPNHPRNCFEMLSATLRILKRRMGDDVLIITAGDEWDVAAYGLSGVVHNLGLLNYQTTGALYRACDAGLVLMMTRHPSYLPLELMASGALVVTNRNPDTSWLLQDEVNSLLAFPTPASLADRVELGLTDLSLRKRITTNAREKVVSMYDDWDKPIDDVYRYVVSKC